MPTFIRNPMEEFLPVKIKNVSQKYWIFKNNKFTNENRKIFYILLFLMVYEVKRKII